mgnify:CR=1 FL=1
MLCIMEPGRDTVHVPVQALILRENRVSDRKLKQNHVIPNPVQVSIQVNNLLYDTFILNDKIVSTS